MTGCLTVWPFEECGINGKCIKPENGTEYCECSGGFSQTLEMNYLVDEEDLNTSICVYNETAVQAMWGVTMVVLGLVSLLGLLSIRTRKQISELKLWFMLVALSFSCSLYRTVKPDKALLGVDFTFSLLVSLSYTVFFVFAYRKFIESFEYIIRKSESIAVRNNTVFHQRARLIQKIHFFTSVGVLITSQSFWVATLTERETSRRIFRTFWGYLFFHFTSAALFTYFTYAEVEVDMKKLLGEGKQTEGYSIHRDPSMIATVQEYLPNVIFLRRALVATHLTWAFMSIMIFFDIWLLWWTYFLPIISVQVSSFGLSFILYRLGAAYLCTKSTAGARTGTSHGKDEAHSVYSHTGLKSETDLGSTTIKSAGVEEDL
mmetsp:Transcript_5123/g.5928  ORF Transcript_5123/g.5928 Transcript_5123/m.5928 type:complete len:374 (+) Transcript_5123:277-1398(+)